MITAALSVFLVTQVAPTPQERIERGERLLEALEYDDAAEEFVRAAADAAADEAIKLRANLLAGIAYRIAGRDVQARSCFRYVLLRVPTWQLDPSASPRVTLFFESVRMELQAEREATSEQREAAGAGMAPKMAPAAATREAEPSDPLGLWLAGTGAVAAGVAGAGAGALQGVLEYSAMRRDERDLVQVAGLALLATMALGVVAAATGGVLIATGGG